MWVVLASTIDMAYRKGQRVMIMQGHLQGRKATVISSHRKGRRVLYELEVDNRFWHFRVRGSYLRKL